MVALAVEQERVGLSVFFDARKVKFFVEKDGWHQSLLLGGAGSLDAGDRKTWAHLADIPQEACSLTSRSPEQASRSSVSLSKRRLRSLDRSNPGRSGRKVAFSLFGSDVSQRSRQPERVIQFAHRGAWLVWLSRISMPAQPLRRCHALAIQRGEGVFWSVYI